MRICVYTIDLFEKLACLHVRGCISPNGFWSCGCGDLMYICKGYYSQEINLYGAGYTNIFYGAIVVIESNNEEFTDDSSDEEVILIREAVVVEFYVA